MDMKLVSVSSNLICPKSGLKGRPVNVKHGARCAMDKVGGRQKNQRGEILIYRYKFAVIS